MLKTPEASVSIPQPHPFVSSIASQSPFSVSFIMVWRASEVNPETYRVWGDCRSGDHTFRRGIRFGRTTGLGEEQRGKEGATVKSHVRPSKKDVLLPHRGRGSLNPRQRSPSRFTRIETESAHRETQVHPRSVGCARRLLAKRFGNRAAGR